MNMEEGDTLLLCSDGLSRYVKDAAMLELIKGKSLEEACDALIEAAKSGGSDDNITCLLIRAVWQSWGGRLFRRLGDNVQSST
jgi:protein phosphatase